MSVELKLMPHLQKEDVVRLRILVALSLIMLLTNSFVMGADKDRENTKAKQTDTIQQSAPNHPANHPARIQPLDVPCGPETGNLCDDTSNYQSPFDTCPNLVCVQHGTDQYGLPIFECTCL